MTSTTQSSSTKIGVTTVKRCRQKNIPPNNIVATMLLENECWKKMNTFVDKDILQKKDSAAKLHYLFNNFLPEKVLLYVGAIHVYCSFYQ